MLTNASCDRGNFLSHRLSSLPTKTRIGHLAYFCGRWRSYVALTDSGFAPGWYDHDHPSRMGSVEMDYSHSYCLEHGLRAVAGVEFLIDRRQVVLDRLLGDEQLLGHLGR